MFLFVLLTINLKLQNVEIPRTRKYDLQNLLTILWGKTSWFDLMWCDLTPTTIITSYLSITTGSEGVSLRFPHDFFSQQRLKQNWNLKNFVEKKSCSLFGLKMSQYIITCKCDREKFINFYIRFFNPQGIGNIILSNVPKKSLAFDKVWRIRIDNYFLGIKLWR